VPDIRHLIPVSAQPSVLFPLVSSAQGFAQWWAEDSLPAASAGVVELGFFGRATVFRLVPELNSPNTGAVWLCETGSEWQGTRIGFRLEPVSSGTRVWFSHDGWREATEYFLSCNTTWGELMYRLKAAAEGLKPGPLFTSGGMAR
jgi:hypothetical protein